MSVNAAFCGPRAFVLTQSMPLRMTTLLLLYFVQGFPLGLFYYAIPAWMAKNSVGTVEIAAVVTAASLPWSLKLINGFILDRYTYLPMGRRRVWIIGAQGVLVLTLLAAAILEPAATDVLALSVIAFLANMAINFQDVGIDSLAVDIMPEDERARAGGIMCGAQFVGIGITSAAAGLLLDHYGLAVCLTGVAFIPALVMIFAVAIRERHGERHLPWTAGATHPHNLNLQIESWWPLLRNSVLAVFGPVSLLLLPALFARSLPVGGFEAFHPVLFQDRGGWTLSEYTSLASSLRLGGGIFSLVIAGYLVERIGPQRVVAAVLFAGMVVLVTMGLAQGFWADDRVLVTFMIVMEILEVLYFVAALTLAMRMCQPAIAATQFTIYMAVSNFGRPAGAMLAASTAGAGSPQWFYWSLAISWGLVFLIVLKARYPDANREQQSAAASLPQGGGPVPALE